MKYKRHNEIIKIVSSYNIETQDELIEFLGEEGYNVTQATISRDIRDLDLVKVAMPDGAYKYVVSHVSRKNPRNTGLLGHSIVDTVVSITCAQNIIVLKTTPGMAQAVAISIDRINDSDILGCVAGDDTIFVATHDSETAQSVSNKIKRLLAFN